MSITSRLFDALEPRRLFASVPTGFSDAAHGSSITNGTAMAFAPDGRLLVLSQGGQVQVVEPDGDVNTALSLTVNRKGERGLLGIALSPQFATNGHVFLYYTELPSGQTVDYSGATTNRISRFTMSGNSINPASETLIVRLDQVNATNHNGGGMAFGPDGKLYVGVGENAVPSNAQSGSNRLGKVLRLNPDGSIPSDNPGFVPSLGSNFTGDNRAIYAAGVRNPYTLAFDPNNGTLLINDVGQSSFEEINRLDGSRNYGWPATEGYIDRSADPAYFNFMSPIHAYERGDGDTTGRAIAGGTFYRSNSSTNFPSAFDGRYFFGDFVSGWINYIDLNNLPDEANGASVFARDTPGIVDLDVGPDGALYYLQRGGGSPGVRRITAAPRPTLKLTGTGTLTITGTAADDEIVLNLKGSKLRVIGNGEASLFRSASVKRIRILAGNGDDVVKLGVGVRAIGADGGDGDDALAGGDNADNLVGGDGHDTLVGHGGNDTLNGGLGRDSINAGAGNDQLIGGTSIDTLAGGAGTDRADDDRRDKRSNIEVVG